MHSGAYELMWFKFGMMMNSIEFNILTLSQVTLTSIQGQKLSCQLSHEVST